MSFRLSVIMNTALDISENFCFMRFEANMFIADSVMEKSLF